MFAGGNLFWALIGNVSQPIFHGGALLKQQRAAYAAFDASKAQYRASVLQAFVDVSDALAGLSGDARLWMPLRAGMRRRPGNCPSPPASLNWAERGDSICSMRRGRGRRRRQRWFRPARRVCPIRSRCIRRWAGACPTSKSLKDLRAARGSSLRAAFLVRKNISKIYLE
jgi:hypothetical protein